MRDNADASRVYLLHIGLHLKKNKATAMPLQQGAAF